MPGICRLLACCMLLLAESGAVSAAETAQQPHRVKWSPGRAAGHYGWSRGSALPRKDLTEARSF